MRIIARRTLKAFWEKHRPAEQPLKAWVREASQAAWEGPEDIKRRYRHASFTKGNRVIFNIGGNNIDLSFALTTNSGSFTSGSWVPTPSTTGSTQRKSE